MTTFDTSHAAGAACRFDYLCELVLFSVAAEGMGLPDIEIQGREVTPLTLSRGAGPGRGAHILISNP